MKAPVKLAIISVLLISWTIVSYIRRPRNSSPPPTINQRVGQVLNILCCLFVVMGAAGTEIVQQYYSSPAPEAQLGRTVAFSGINGKTIYITSKTNRLFSVCFAACVVTFFGGMFWSSKNKTQNPKNRESQSQPTSPVCQDVSGCPAPLTTPRSIRVLDHSKRLDTPPGKFAYYWQRRKWKRHLIVLGVLGMTIGVWIDQHGATNWWPRIIMLGITGWILTFLVDYRMCVDGQRKTFTNEKLLFGHYHVGARSLPLSEFNGVAIDSHDDSDGCLTTYYVCLKRCNGRLMQVCYFEALRGRRSDEAEQAAQELAEMTGLQLEAVSS